MFSFEGKNIVVFGAGSGLGRGVATEYARAGGNVWMGDYAETGGRETLEALSTLGHKAGFTRADISKPEDVDRLYEDAVSALGSVDVIANCAGTFLDKHFFEATPGEIERSLSVNLLGVILSCQAGMARMVRQGNGGAVVNLSSVGGRRGDKPFPYYAVGKSAIINFTQSAALNGAPHGIRVNCVCPGMIRTPMWDTILRAEFGDDTGRDDELFEEVVQQRVPLGRPQTPQEIAWAVLFLSSPYAASITGQALNVCGGDAMN